MLRRVVAFRTCQGASTFGQALAAKALSEHASASCVGVGYKYCAKLDLAPRVGAGGGDKVNQRHLFAELQALLSTGSQRQRRLILHCDKNTIATSVLSNAQHMIIT